MLVIDASVAVAWVLDDEASEYADRTLTIVRDEGAIVTKIWSIEVTNALVYAERRGRIREDKLHKAIELLRTLTIKISDTTQETDFGAILALSRKYNLSTYDSSYIHLAQSADLPLASLDEKMKEVAKKVKVELFK